MQMILSQNGTTLWRETIQAAETACAVDLDQALEAYLVALLGDYVNQPHLFKHAVALSFLEAKNSQDDLALKQAGDQCLLVTGLFPRFIETRLVKIDYFVNIGQCAYSSLSHHADDLFGLLAHHFVPMMDVLQSIRETDTLLPLEAYEQWQLVGSERAKRILAQYRVRR